LTLGRNGNPGPWITTSDEPRQPVDEDPRAFSLSDPESIDGPGEAPHNWLLALQFDEEEFDMPILVSTREMLHDDSVDMAAGDGAGCCVDGCACTMFSQGDGNVCTCGHNSEQHTC